MKLRSQNKLKQTYYKRFQKNKKTPFKTNLTIEQ